MKYLALESRAISQVLARSAENRQARLRNSHSPLLWQTWIITPIPERPEGGQLCIHSRTQTIEDREYRLGPVEHGQA